MDKVLAFLIALVLVYGIYNSLTKSPKPRQSKSESCDVCQITKGELSLLQKELKSLQNPHYVKQYIVDVIDHGSYDLGFKGGVMEGGFASHEDAQKIACYVLTLSGKQCSHPYPRDAQMFYTSICGGCHGDDGKGGDGTYPDLTKKKLLGIAIKEERLKAQIAALQAQTPHHEN